MSSRCCAIFRICAYRDPSPRRGCRFRSRFTPGNTVCMLHWFVPRQVVPRFTFPRKRVRRKSSRYPGNLAAERERQCASRLNFLLRAVRCRFPQNIVRPTRIDIDKNSKLTKIGGTKWNEVDYSGDQWCSSWRSRKPTYGTGLLKLSVPVSHEW